MELDDLIAAIERMPAEDQAALAEEVTEGTKNKLWVPQPGPQTDCYYSDAYLTLYGGSAGSGKSDILLGLAFNEHKKSLIVRRQYTDLEALTDRAKEINGVSKGYNGSSPPRLTAVNNAVIDFGAVKDDGGLNTWQGKARDFLGIDEAAQFPEDIVRTLMGWVRSVDLDQRCQVVLASNPPLSDEGQWLTRMFAPWLDPKHPNPAEPGELRWYISNEHGEDTAVPGPGGYVFEGDYAVPTDRDVNEDDVYDAQSRTFIPAKLKDNHYLLDTGYKQMLDNLPKHMRKALRDGDFEGARSDHALQLIDSAWIKAAQDRWTREPPHGRPMCSMGVDVAGGGQDRNVIAARHDGWFAELIEEPGRNINSGREKAGWIMQHRENRADVTIDLGGGYGDSTKEVLAANIDDPSRRYVFGWKGAEATREKTSRGTNEFYNKRALGYYRLREALDPDQPGGSRIALPPDPGLYSELAAIRYDKNWSDQRVIKLEPKKDLIARLGYSTDKADAVVMAWSRGPKAESYYKTWEDARHRSSTPKVNVAKRSARSRHGTKTI
jgi:hypothetical protein